MRFFSSSWVAQCMARHKTKYNKHFSFLLLVVNQEDAHLEHSKSHLKRLRAQYIAWSGTWVPWPFLFHPRARKSLQESRKKVTKKVGKKVTFFGVFFFSSLKKPQKKKQKIILQIVFFFCYVSYVCCGVYSCCFYNILEPHPHPPPCQNNMPYNSLVLQHYAF